MTDKVTITQLVSPDASLRTIELDVEHVAIIPLSQDYDRMALRIESGSRTVGLFSSVISVQIERATSYDVVVTGDPEAAARAIPTKSSVEDHPLLDGELANAAEEQVGATAWPSTPEAVRKLKLPELKDLAAKLQLEVKGNKPEYVEAITNRLFPQEEQAQEPQPQEQEQAQEAPQAAVPQQQDESTGFFPQASPVAPQPAPQAPQQPVAPPQPPTTGSTPFNF